MTPTTLTNPHPKCGELGQRKACGLPATGFVVVEGATTPKFRCQIHLGSVVRWALHYNKTFWVYDIVLAQSSEKEAVS